MDYSLENNFDRIGNGLDINSKKLKFSKKRTIYRLLCAKDIQNGIILKNLPYLEENSLPACYSVHCLHDKPALLIVRNANNGRFETAIFCPSDRSRKHILVSSEIIFLEAEESRLYYLQAYLKKNQKLLLQLAENNKDKALHGYDLSLIPAPKHDWKEQKIIGNILKLNKESVADLYLKPIQPAKELDLTIISEAGSVYHYTMKQPDNISFPADLMLNLKYHDIEKFGKSEVMLSGVRFKINFNDYRTALNFLTVAVTFFRTKTMVSFYFNGKAETEKEFVEHSAAHTICSDESRLASAVIQSGSCDSKKLYKYSTDIELEDTREYLSYLTEHC